MGILALTVMNLISIILGRYGDIKTNSIFGVVMILIGMGIG